MTCPHCQSNNTTHLKRTTNLDYPVFRCHTCARTLKDRTGTPFNFIEVPTDIVFQVLFSRVQFKLSLRDLVEFFLLLRIRGRWCYLYRAIDSDSNLVDSRLSQKRDMVAAKAFFRQALEVPQQLPEQVVTDRLASYPRAIAEELGTEVEHEVRGCQGNPVEQNHRPIKARYCPTLGFGTFDSGKRLCKAFDELHQYFRPRQRMTESVCLSEQRGTFRQRAQELKSLFITA